MPRLARHLRPLATAALATAIASSDALAQPMTVWGRAVDDRGCSPVAGARVSFGGSSAVTDALGRFRLTGAPGTLAASAGGFDDLSRTIAADTGVPHYEELRLTRPRAASAPVRARLAFTADPARPKPGAIVRIRLTSQAAPRDARLGDEPLHFRRAAGGAWDAIAGIPLTAADTVSLVVGTGSAARSAVVPLSRGDYPVERLRVAPEFGREPDEALSARLEHESEQARDVGCRAHLTPALWTAPFAAPRPGRVTSGFGRGREYNGTVTGRHTGTDFAGPTGSPIRAANRGVVRLVGRFYLGGNAVYVDHGAGLVTAYLHMSRTLVAVGDTVQRGQTLGLVGATGRVTGPHLHWIVRYGLFPVDGATLLGRR